ncbi:hypothetical protein CTAYLR_001305 [Chrysophaeum taylorii]|uniref:Protein ENHANCED DISEASE RESISTANCE 2 C-terminal domain-containing protein n=1 Tax=Chrysophaeum taylorii TaxID=2483200 RepID=A0AAD7UCR6_9STRA|nr:hypothetical protein CTAYLR_001305 [Chrysophaeum taylorii]
MSAPPAPAAASAATEVGVEFSVGDHAAEGGLSPRNTKRDDGKSPGIFVSTAHALRRKIKRPSDERRRRLARADTAKAMPTHRSALPLRNGASDNDKDDEDDGEDDGSDAASVQSAADIEIDTATAAAAAAAAATANKDVFFKEVFDDPPPRKQRERSPSPPARERRHLTPAPASNDSGKTRGRVERAVHRIATGHAAAGARRRLFQLRDKVRRDAKLPRELAPLATTLTESRFSLGGARRRTAQAPGKDDHLSSERVATGDAQGETGLGDDGADLSALADTHDLPYDDDRDEDEGTVVDLLARCFSSTVSLVMAAAAATTTCVVVVLSDGSGMFRLQVVAAVVSLLSLVSHADAAYRWSSRLAIAALSRQQHPSRAPARRNDQQAKKTTVLSHASTEEEDHRQPTSGGSSKRRTYLRRWRASSTEPGARPHRHKQEEPAPPHDESAPTPRKEEPRGIKIVPIAKDKTSGGPAKTRPPNTWSRPDSESFHLRGEAYMDDGVKQPSAPATYDPAEARVAVASAGPIRSVTDLPEVLRRSIDRGVYQPFSADRRRGRSYSSEDYELASGLRATGHLPRFLFVSINLPLEGPSLRPSRQGTRYAVMVTFFALSDYARSIVKTEEDMSRWPAALQLAETWLRTAPVDLVLNGRLKGIFNAHDSPAARSAFATSPYLAPRQVPRLAQKWNAKPVLMANNSTFGGGRTRQGISVVTHGSHGEGNTYVEVNIDVGDSFSYIARGAIYLVQNRLPTMGPLDIALTIEGRQQEELPEALLAAITFNQIDVTL